MGSERRRCTERREDTHHFTPPHQANIPFTYYHYKLVLTPCIRKQNVSLHPIPPTHTHHQLQKTKNNPKLSETATTTTSAAAGKADAGGEVDKNDTDGDRAEEVASLDDLFALLAAQRRGEMLFAEELAKPDDEINFVKAAMYIAMHRRPDFSRVEVWLPRLN